MSIQPTLDLFDGVDQAPTPASRPAYARPLPGQPPRWTRLVSGTGQHHCAGCMREQDRAWHAGRPAGLRARAVVRRTTADRDEDLCDRHAREQGWAPARGRRS